jgi:hypothetical protein
VRLPIFRHARSLPEVAGLHKGKLIASLASIVSKCGLRDQRSTNIETLSDSAFGLLEPPHEIGHYGLNNLNGHCCRNIANFINTEQPVIP